MDSSASAEGIEAERNRLDKLPRLGHPPPTQALYEQTNLEHPENITMDIACIGFNINRETYDVLWDYCKAELEKNGGYKIDLPLMWLKSYIFHHHLRWSEDPRLAFFKNDGIPYLWSSWALCGIFCKVAIWLLDNEEAMDTLRRKRTIDDAEEEGTDLGLYSKRLKTAPDPSEVLMSDGDF